MSSGLPAVSLRRALEPEELDPRALPPPPPMPGVGAYPSLREPQQFVPEREAQMAPPSFGRQLLEGLAETVAGTSLQPGPGATFGNAGLPILGLLGSQLLARPILQNRNERESFNERQRKLADARNASRISMQETEAADESAFRRSARLKALETPGGSDEPLVLINTPDGPRYVRRSVAVGQAPPPENPPGIGQLYPVVGPDGKVTYATAGNAVGAPVGKIEPPPTPAESMAASFYPRAYNAVANAEKVERALVKAGNKALLGLDAPPMFQDETQKLYRQSMEDFALAFLRRESMANIKADEFDQIRKAFFAQPGETERTMAQKAKSRKLAMEGVKSGRIMTVEDIAGFIGGPSASGRATAADSAYVKSLEF